MPWQESSRPTAGRPSSGEPIPSMCHLQVGTFPLAQNPCLHHPCDCHSSVEHWASPPHDRPSRIPSWLSGAHSAFRFLVQVPVPRCPSHPRCLRSTSLQCGVLARPPGVLQVCWAGGVGSRWGCVSCALYTTPLCPRPELAAKQNTSSFFTPSASKPNVFSSGPVEPGFGAHVEELTIIRSKSLLAQPLITKGPSSSLVEKPFLKVLLVQSVLPAAGGVSPLLRLSPCLSFPAFPPSVTSACSDPLRLTGLPDSPGTVCLCAFID